MTAVTMLWLCCDFPFPVPRPYRQTLKVGKHRYDNIISYHIDAFQPYNVWDDACQGKYRNKIFIAGLSKSASSAHEHSHLQVWTPLCFKSDIGDILDVPAWNHKRSIRDMMRHAMTYGPGLLVSNGNCRIFMPSMVPSMVPTCCVAVQLEASSRPFSNASMVFFPQAPAQFMKTNLSHRSVGHTTNYWILYHLRLSIDLYIWNIAHMHPID